MEVTLATIEQELVTNLKAKNQIAIDTLRGLKTRVQNEQIAQGRELSSEELLALVKSEAKRRKEAVESFRSGGREDQAVKEEQELTILQQFLPPQLSEEAVTEAIESAVASNNWTAVDFGSAMGALKAQLGNSVDGAMLAKILKQKLN